MWLSDGALLSSHSHHDAGVNCSELAHQASFWPSQGMFLFLCSRFLRLLPSDFTSHLPPPAPANRLRMPKIKYVTLHTVCLTVSKSKSVYSCSKCPKLKVVQRACHHPPGSIPLPPKSLSKSSCLFVCLMQWVTEMEIKEPCALQKTEGCRQVGRHLNLPSSTPLATWCPNISAAFCSTLSSQHCTWLSVFMFTTTGITTSGFRAKPCENVCHYPHSYTIIPYRLSTTAALPPRLRVPPFEKKRCKMFLSDGQRHVI